MFNGIIYPIRVSAINALKNIITKSHFLDFIKNTSTTNSSMFFMFYKHFFKSIVYIIISIIAYILFKDNYLQKYKKAFNDYPNILKYIIIFSALEILLGFMFYKSLLHNNLNKFVIYVVISAIVFNGLISYFIYNEKLTPQLIFGYIICILGIAIVKFS